MPAARYNILRPLVDADGNFVSNEQVEVFNEAPAPAQTLGARLLELQMTTGFEHIAEPKTKIVGDSGIRRKRA